METQKIEIIKDSLHKLISSLIWLISISLIVLFAQIQGLTNISFGQFTINSDISGWFILIVLFVQALSITKNYDTVITNFKSLEIEENINKARLYLNSYSHLLNPFADQEGSIRTKYLDFWGFLIFSIVPTLSLLLALNLIEAKSILEKAFVVFLVIIISWIKLEHALVEKHAIYLICPNSQKRKRLSILFIGIPMIIIGLVYYWSIKYGW